MIKIKSFHPDSVALKFTVDHQTTASVGPTYKIVPYDGIIEEINYGMGIKTTSARVVSIRNLTKSMSYLNCATIMNSGAVGLVTELGMSSSDAGTSGAFGRPWVSAGTLLSINWSATKGDTAFSIVCKRTNAGEN